MKRHMYTKNPITIRVRQSEIESENWPQGSKVGETNKMITTGAGGEEEETKNEDKLR